MSLRRISFWGSFQDFMTQNISVSYQFNVTMLQILLQVYIPLGLLKKSFTHYDLHYNNVLIYTLPNNQYVTLKYIVNGENIVSYFVEG